MKYLSGIFSVILLVFASSCYGQDLKKFKARNGVDFEYEIVFPKNYAQNKSYELAIVFSELERKERSHKLVAASLAQNANLNNAIYVIPKVPVGEPHWISHPIHHGLNDLMKSMRQQYGKSNQKFHFIGHLLGGRVAQTYSGMSSQYVASLSFAHSRHWKITKQEYFDDVFNNSFRVYVYDKDAEDLAINISKANFDEADSFVDAMIKIDHDIKSL